MMSIKVRRREQLSNANWESETKRFVASTDVPGQFAYGPTAEMAVAALREKVQARQKG